jgi:hypothetical protein
MAMAVRKPEEANSVFTLISRSSCRQHAFYTHSSTLIMRKNSLGSLMVLVGMRGGNEVGTRKKDTPIVNKTQRHELGSR